MCTVYNPCDEFTNLTVRWLRQRTEVEEGIQCHGQQRFTVTVMQSLHELTKFNDSYLQPSQNAWLHADSCTNYAGYYFRNANEPQWVNATYPTLFPPVTSSSLATTVTATHTNNLHVTTKTSMDLLTTEPNMEPIFYIFGVLSSLTLSL